MGKAPEGVVSPELYKFCSEKPIDAKAHFQTREVKDVLATRNINADKLPVTHLMTWWSDIDQDGVSYSAVGSSGVCDASGYTFTPESWWRNNMSSIGSAQASHRYCNTVKVYDRAILNSTTFPLPIGYMGTLNDNVGKVRVFLG